MEKTKRRGWWGRRDDRGGGATESEEYDISGRREWPPLCNGAAGSRKTRCTTGDGHMETGVTT